LTFDLVGIGNPVYDIIVTPSVKTDGRILSGCSTNGCLAAKRLGLERVGLLGRIGSDFADKFRSDMKNFGIEISLDLFGAETGGFRLIYDEHGDRTLDVLGVADRISAGDIPDDYLDASFFLIGPILGEVDLRLIEFIRTSSSGTLFLDPQGLVRVIGSNGRIAHRCDREVFKKMVNLVDFVKPNENESYVITGFRDPTRALVRLKDLGTALPIVTLAERGSILIEGDDTCRIPAFPTKAIDPTGAGDVYAGAFVTRYASTKNTVDAALFASAAASLMVEQLGPEFAISREVVEKRKEFIRGMAEGVKSD
jgi:sugar/nucleoside kinase (ribokinase family)